MTEFNTDNKFIPDIATVVIKIEEKKPQVLNKGKQNEFRFSVGGDNFSPQPARRSVAEKDEYLRP